MPRLDVLFGDKDGRAVGMSTWTPAAASVEGGYALVGCTMDWSNPDEGIHAILSYAGFGMPDPSDDGSIFDFLPHHATIVTSEELTRSLSVSVDGQVVLERLGGDTVPDFKCGLSWSPMNGAPDEADGNAVAFAATETPEAQAPDDAPSPDVPDDALPAGSPNAFVSDASPDETPLQDFTDDDLDD